MKPESKQSKTTTRTANASVAKSARKQQVSERLTKTAARQLRERGPEGISVKSVMASEGMTVGGFYAHFASKEALVVAALEEAFAETHRRAPDKPLDPDYLRGFLRRYLSMAHRDQPGVSCPIASLASDMPRESDAVRAVYQQGLQSLIAALAKALPVGSEQEAQRLAMSMAATAIGALQLARAVPDEAFSKRILDECLDTLLKLIDRSIDRSADAP